MKIKYIYLAIVAAVLTLFACTPDDLEMASIEVKPEQLKEGVAYSITYDSENPNIVHLKSLMDDSYTPLWIHPQGRSQEREVTLRIPFAGTYDVLFGVETRGGYVYAADTARFTVADLYADFISDPLWSMISGGAGESKTWVLDLDAEGVSRHFLGPIYFFTAGYTWDNLHNAAGENYLDASSWDATTAIVPNITDGAATWYWLADWAGNSWMCDKADFGEMTFDLKGGANISVDQEAYGLGKATGSYMLDVDAHTIKFSGASPLHDVSRDAEVKATATFHILYMSDDFMQLMVPETGTCYNYISKEYKDNWTPGKVEDPEPELPDGWKDDVSQTVSTTIVWSLSDVNPLNWCQLSGAPMNEWNAPEDYPDWLGTLDPAAYAGFALSLDSKENSYECVAPDGTKTTSTYTLDEKGIYTFSPVLPGFSIIGWAGFHTTADGQLRIMSIEKDAMGAVTGMWLGAKDPDKAEYMAYHLVPKAGASAETDPDAAVKRKLCAHTWKIDVGGVKFGGPLTYADPASSNWETGWTPDIPGNSWLMADGDHGSMKFNEDGTVTVEQHVFTDGVVTDTQQHTGTWSLEGKKLALDIPILHAYNLDPVVRNWGDATLFEVGDDYIRLAVVRDPELSGEDEYILMFNYIAE